MEIHNVRKTSIVYLLYIYSKEGAVVIVTLGTYIKGCQLCQVKQTKLKQHVLCPQILKSYGPISLIIITVFVV